LKEETVPYFLLEPPKQFIHPFKGPVIERVVSSADVERLCGFRWSVGVSCSWVLKGACHIIRPKDGPITDAKAIRRHELAHCNGWPVSHPGGHLVQVGK
jgi:hypothetical protein